MHFEHGFLIATPAIRKGPFRQSVVYVFEHAVHRVLGLIINKPLSVSLDEFLGRKKSRGHCPLFLGGPTQVEDRGFVLHGNYGRFWQGTLQLSKSLFITVTRDILPELDQFDTKSFRVVVGYSLWSGKKIFEEILSSNWIFVPFQDLGESILFHRNPYQLWELCYQKLGFSPYSFHQSYENEVLLQ